MEGVLAGGGDRAPRAVVAAAGLGLQDVGGCWPCGHGIVEELGEEGVGGAVGGAGGQLHGPNPSVGVEDRRLPWQRPRSGSGAQLGG